MIIRRTRVWSWRYGLWMGGCWRAGGRRLCCCLGRRTRLRMVKQGGITGTATGMGTGMSGGGRAAGDCGVRRARRGRPSRFQRKFDVEHDIAVVKRAVYAPLSTSVLSSESPAVISPSPVSPTPKAEGWAVEVGVGEGRRRRRRLSMGTGGADVWERDDEAEAETLGVCGKAGCEGSTWELVPESGPEGADSRVCPTVAAAVAGGTSWERMISGVYMLRLGAGHSPGRRPSGLAVPPRGVG